MRRIIAVVWGRVWSVRRSFVAMLRSILLHCLVITAVALGVLARMAECDDVRGALGRRGTPMLLAARSAAEGRTSSAIGRREEQPLRLRDAQQPSVYAGR
jgi:hypothetical protein